MKFLHDHLRLGINIDHVATVRNARGGEHPQPIRAAFLAMEAGADGITAHLREDRRHITDDDLWSLVEHLKAPLNLEMAATEGMVEIALKAKPHAVCLVPERRQEVTTEGGLDAAGSIETLGPIVSRLGAAGIRVSLFIDPDRQQVEAAHRLKAPVVELHTGTYSHARGPVITTELERLQHAAELTETLGIECHAGHGLDYANVAPVAGIRQMAELNIGHFLVGEAIFDGLAKAIHKMRMAMDDGRMGLPS